MRHPSLQIRRSVQRAEVGKLASSLGVKAGYLTIFIVAYILTRVEGSPGVKHDAQVRKICVYDEVELPRSETSLNPVSDCARENEANKTSVHARLLHEQNIHPSFLLT